MHCQGFYFSDDRFGPAAAGTPTAKERSTIAVPMRIAGRRRRRERLAGEVGGRTQRLGPSFPTGCGTSELEQQLAASIKMVETRKQALQATGRPPRKGFPNPPCKFPISLHIGTYPAQAEA